MHQYSMYYLLAINALSFILFGLDKYKAKKGNRRQAESNIKLAYCRGAAFDDGQNAEEDHSQMAHI